jgi:hypothetical protein
VKYIIDIDGTICNITNGNYIYAQPLVERINFINNLYDNGHVIWYYTARGMNRFNDNSFKAKLKFKRLTKKQLSEWNVKYHKLLLGKPSADYYIDDKAIYLPTFFGE